MPIVNKIKKGFTPHCTPVIPCTGMFTMYFIMNSWYSLVKQSLKYKQYFAIYALHTTAEILTRGVCTHHSFT